MANANHVSGDPDPVTNGQHTVDTIQFARSTMSTKTAGDAVPTDPPDSTPASTTSEKPIQASAKQKTLAGEGPLIEEDPTIAPLLMPSLFRMTEGLPRQELKVMISEAAVCEESIEREIKELREALSGDTPLKPAVQIMVESEVTPPDRYFTVSALLGRLRDDLATPLPPNSTLLRGQAGSTQPPPKKKKKENNATAGDTTTTASNNASGTASSPTDPTALTALEKQKQLLSLINNPEYNREHAQPTALLALWKKVSTHRSSLVFRRPVNPKDAPGYEERILFPMDLSLIRKMIVSRQIRTYRYLHQRLGLICHNCVKYNGRESDYGIVTRDFERYVDDMILTAVATAAPTTKEAAAPAPTQIQSAVSNTAVPTSAPQTEPVTSAPAVPQPASGGDPKSTTSTSTAAETAATKQQEEPKAPADGTSAKS